MYKLLLVSVLLLLNIGNTKNTTRGVATPLNKEIDTNTAVSMQDVLYEGTLDGTTKIRLFINEQEHPCGGAMTLLNAMYTSENHQKWILLNSTTGLLKKKFCMVEDHFTGVFFLEKNETSLNGYWVSPNTHEKYEVKLKKAPLNATKKEHLQEILFDDLLYHKNDC